MCRNRGGKIEYIERRRELNKKRDKKEKVNLFLDSEHEQLLLVTLGDYIFLLMLVKISLGSKLPLNGYLSGSEDQ